MAMRVVYAIYIGRGDEQIETYDSREIYDRRSRQLTDQMIEHVRGRAAVCDKCGFVATVIDTWVPHRCE